MHTLKKVMQEVSKQHRRPQSRLEVRQLNHHQAAASMPAGHKAGYDNIVKPCFSSRLMSKVVTSGRISCAGMACCLCRVVSTTAYWCRFRWKTKPVKSLARKSCRNGSFRLWFLFLDEASAAAAATAHYVKTNLVQEKASSSE